MITAEEAREISIECGVGRTLRIINKQIMCAARKGDRYIIYDGPMGETVTNHLVSKGYIITEVPLNRHRIEW